MVISGGEKQYFMTANDRTYDVEEYLDRLGVLEATSNDDTNTSSSTINMNGYSIIYIQFKTDHLSHYTSRNERFSAEHKRRLLPMFSM